MYTAVGYASSEINLGYKATGYSSSDTGGPRLCTYSRPSLVFSRFILVDRKLVYHIIDNYKLDNIHW